MAERRGRWTLLEVLEWTRGHFAAKGVENPRLDAEVLLAHVLETERVMLYARFDQPMAPDELAKMRQLVARRAAGVPVAHLVGRREFWSLDLVVTADVLVPRPETEELAVRLIDSAFAQNAGDRLADIGTGSGCLALALAQARPQAVVYGSDIDSDALSLAAENARQTGLQARVRWLQGDLLQPFAPRSLHAVVSNPPYVCEAEYRRLPLHIRGREPRRALCAGSDGLAALRPLIAGAAETLTPGGRIALEIGEDQGPAVAGLLQQAGFRSIEIARDLAGRTRFALARRPC